MAENQLSFTEMVQHVGVSRAALLICCNKHGKAGKRMLSKLAPLLDKTEIELDIDCI